MRTQEEPLHYVSCNVDWNVSWVRQMRIDSKAESISSTDSHKETDMLSLLVTRSSSMAVKMQDILDTDDAFQ